MFFIWKFYVVVIIMALSHYFLGKGRVTSGSFLVNAYVFAGNCAMLICLTEHIIQTVLFFALVLVIIRSKTYQFVRMSEL